MGRSGGSDKGAGVAVRRARLSRSRRRWEKRSSQLHGRAWRPAVNGCPQMSSVTEGFGFRNGSGRENARSADRRQSSNATAAEVLDVRSWWKRGEAEEARRRMPTAHTRSFPGARLWMCTAAHPGGSGLSAVGYCHSRDFPSYIIVQVSNMLSQCWLGPTPSRYASCLTRRRHVSARSSA